MMTTKFGFGPNVGSSDGPADGVSDNSTVGLSLGTPDGRSVGNTLGGFDASSVGTELKEGEFDGEIVGDVLGVVVELGSVLCVEDGSGVGEDEGLLDGV